MTNRVWTLFQEWLRGRESLPREPRDPAVERVLNMSFEECERSLWESRMRHAVKYTMLDGVEPTKLENLPGEPIGLRCAVDINLKGGTFPIKLGLKFSVPVLVVSLLNDQSTEVVPPGKEVTATLKGPVVVGRGEQVAWAFALTNSGAVLQKA